MDERSEDSLGEATTLAGLVEPEASMPAPDIIWVDGGEKYQMVREIARGGMGAIYEAKDLKCRRYVVLKVLPQELEYPEEDVVRFISEAQITSQLEHPNIVPIHEVGLDMDGNVFYAMKYVRGMTLTEILMGIRQGNEQIIEDFPLSRLLNLFQKVCDAVAFAHAQHVIHRDIKTDNVMVGEFGEVVLMDWGLAKLLSDEEVANETDRLEPVEIIDETADDNEIIDSVRTDRFGSGLKTISGRVMGTPGFMAPEQAMAGQVPLDTRCDVYALGAILYSILTLRPSVGGDSINEVIKRIVEGEIRPPTDYNHPEEHGLLDPGEHPQQRFRFAHCPDGVIPRAVADIAMKAMETNPDDRYPSVTALQRDVENYQEGLIWQLVTEQDFSSRQDLEQWRVYGGKHDFQQGGFRLHGGSPQILLLAQRVHGDVRIEFECSQNSVCQNTIGCFLNANWPQSESEPPSGGYEFKLGAYDNSMNVLSRSDQKLWGESGRSLERGAVYRICAERIGGRVRVWVNNREMVDFVDSDPLSGEERCAVGLVGWEAETLYHWVRIYSLRSPWKCDVIDMAERQMQKGHYEIALGLFEEVVEAFPDEERLRRARKGMADAQARKALKDKLPHWREKLEQAWQCRVQLRLDNKGLSVDITDGGVRDLSPLQGLPVKALFCAGNHIEDLAPLAGTALTTLTIDGNPVTDLSPLQGMPLEMLFCECCQIQSIEPLQGMPLTLLNIGGNEVEDLSPLAGMALTFIGCWGNRITSLEPLRGMALTSVYIGDNRITSLEPLSGMPLTMIHTAGNPIRSLEPLRGMNLTSLYCNDCQIESLEPLRGMKLTMASCQHNRIASIEPLVGMPLGALTCGGNPIQDLDCFLEQPPEDFLYETPTLSDAVLYSALAFWSGDTRYALQAANLRVVLALRAQDVAALRSLASEFRGHRYLFVPVFMTWPEAEAFCESLGGHLVTISDRETDEFVSSLFRGGAWCWIGISGKTEGPRWVDGRPVIYHNFPNALQRLKPRPKIFCGNWSSEDIRNAHNSFIIEWDD